MARLPSRMCLLFLAAGSALALAMPVVVAATVNGTDRADVLRGTDRADDIRALAGDDVVTAGGGNDVVRSGPGADVVRLGPGADRAYNPSGADVIHGGRGADVAVDAHAADLGNGNDRYHATTSGCLGIDLGRGNDVAPGETTDYYGGTGHCVIRGGLGDDTIKWTGYDGPEGPKQTILIGGAGADSLTGGDNDDVLIGGGGPDVIRADEDTWLRSDVVIAGAGDDEIYADWENDGGGPIDCGPGTDTVHGVAPSRVLINCEIVNP